jgi:hypothetical protein
MRFVHRIFKSDFVIKLRHWEYWPFGIIHAPFFIYWLLLSLKERSLFFFSASNPGIFMGGMLGESKFDVHKKLPEEVRPKTALIQWPVSADNVVQCLREIGFQFPLIFKPDMGERGWKVRRINSYREAEEYRKEVKIDFLIQELIDLPLEFGVFYVRYPREESGKVISIVGKEMLFIEGDGKKTIQQLILEKDRARLQWKVLRVTHRLRLQEVLPKGEKLELVSIGNHCIGTKFLNCNHLITDTLSASFDRISKQVDGFYFGRYDVRVPSIEDLEKGKVKVLELNGCGAEPSHIYEPGFSLWKALQVLLQHWNYIYRISTQNHALGVRYLSFAEGRLAYRKSKSLTASA